MKATFSKPKIVSYQPDGAESETVDGPADQENAGVRRRIVSHTTEEPVHSSMILQGCLVRKLYWRSMGLRASRAFQLFEKATSTVKIPQPNIWPPARADGQTEGHWSGES